MKTGTLKLAVLAACAAGWAAAQVDVLTWHNDNMRSGHNTLETVLTPANVKPATFGKIGFLATDGLVDAQPLVVTGLPIPHYGKRDVLFVATENDTLYAADANTGAVLYQVSMLGRGETPSDARNCNQVTPTIGITSTPVIDRGVGNHGTIYLVAMTKDSNGGYHHRLHALELATGEEEFGGPVEIRATYPGHGPTSVNGVVTFDPAQYKERAALLLLNGVIYTSWASHCDIEPYTAWIMGYDESTLAQKSVLNLTANGSQGAMWGSGAGPAAGPAGAVYVQLGNGTFDTTLNSQGFPSLGDYGNAIVELFPVPGSLRVKDYFTMSSTVYESQVDEDLGSGGAMVVPALVDAAETTHYLVVGAGKDGNLYLADRTNMGKFNASADHIYQELDGALPGGIWSAPAYYDHMIYYSPQGGPMLAFGFDQSTMKLQAAPLSSTSGYFNYPGLTPSVSANAAGNAIVWGVENGSSAVLHAFLARNLGVEIYNSNMASGGRDLFGPGNKFQTPTIANGRVYAASATGVGIFGLLP
jgi:hypothetical protein